MIEERGRVLSVDDGAVWVETVRRSTCGTCSARAGCGQHLLERLGARGRQGFIRAISGEVHSVGDEVVIAIPESAVVRGSLWVYAVPLTGLFAGALLAQHGGLGEPGVIAAAFTGLAAGFGLVRWHSNSTRRDPALQPRVIRCSNTPH